MERAGGRRGADGAEGPGRGALGAGSRAARRLVEGVGRALGRQVGSPLTRCAVSGWEQAKSTCWQVGRGGRARGGGRERQPSRAKRRAGRAAMGRGWGVAGAPPRGRADPD